MNAETRRRLAELVSAAQQYGFVLGRGVSTAEALAKERGNLSEKYETFRQSAETEQKMLPYRAK